MNHNNILYPLTSQQKLFWLTEKLYPGTGIGNVAGTLRIKGNINYELLERAINIFIEKNDGMRIRITEEDGETKQYVSEYKYKKLDFYDFSDKDIDELFKYDECLTKVPFKLIESDLYYFAIIKVNEEDGGFYIKTHHLISDAWTMSLLGSQIVKYYSALKNGLQILGENNPSYIEYIESEEKYIQSSRFGRDKEYWDIKFKSKIEPTALKLRKSQLISIKARRKTFIIPKKLSKKMREYCNQNKVSIFTAFLAALSMYINRVTAKEDIILGTTTLNRANIKEKHTIGMFSGLVSTIININNNESFETLVENISQNNVSLLRHQKYPYDLLLRQVRERHKTINNLFDIVLNYQNSKFDKSYGEEYITRWHFNGYQTEMLNIHLNDRENEGDLIIDYDYLIDLFHFKEIDFIHQHVINLLWHAFDDPSKKISQLDMLSEKEKHKILYEFNKEDKTKNYIFDKNLNLLPIGIAGELYTSDQSKVLKKEPILNPFNAQEKLYATGGMARWYPKGEIMRLGKMNCENNNERQIKIVSTFTSEPVGDYIRWWGNKFGFNPKIEFAGYNQVFQELLDSESILSKNKNGINVLLVRFEDYIRNDNGAENVKLSKLEKIFEELKQALSSFDNAAPLITVIFPVSNHLNLSFDIKKKINELNIRFQEELSKYNSIYMLDLKETQELYGIRDVFDEIKDKEAHMPFTEVYYAAIGTQIARKICSIIKQQFKVIVLDCDNTLWKGVCGERGTLRVKIKGAYRVLQEFLVQKYSEGMLLAICTKNNEKDVMRVFEKNPDMILNKNHIVNWKINWDEKSENIKKISNELNLGLDSFIFIDDNPIECSKMVEKCPEVLTLQLPSKEEYIPVLLKHVWAFDRVKITVEDTLRSSMYQAEQNRKEMQETGISLEDYIKNLELKISMREIKDEETSRAAQLTHRTNQFNLSTIRRTEKEIKELIQNNNAKCLVVEASDKFGDYGIIGLVILKEETEKLFIDTLLLSCRILGRRAEDSVLSGIRKFAEERGKKELEAVFIPTAKNKPIRDFIERMKWNVAEKNGKRIKYNVAVNDLPEKIEHISFYYNDMYKKKSEILEAFQEQIFALDHVAIAVKDIKEAEKYYKTLGYNIGNSVYDPLQNSYLSMCKSSRYIPIELVAPVNEKSPSYNKVQMHEETPYHLCYKVSNIEKFLEKIKKLEYETISCAKPAILFNNQKVAFIMIKKVGLIELVETEVQLCNKDKNNKYKNNTIRVVINDFEKALAFYKELGYIEEKNIKDTKNNLIIAELIGCWGEKLELITPLDKNTIEYDFLKHNGAGVFKIQYRISEKESKKLNENDRIYNLFCKAEANKNTIKEEYSLCDVEVLQKTKHKEYLLPIVNYTGKRLLRLPLYEGMHHEITEYEAPTNETEEKLARIWGKVLRTKRIGVNNNYFELGGDSLSAVNIIARIHKEFNVELTLLDIFQANTIKKLAQKIKSADKSQYEQINPIEKKEYYDLSSAQKRMYILHQIDQEQTGYNECQKILIVGSLDLARLEKAFKEFINRHEALRTGFEIAQGEPKQKIYSEVDFQISYMKAEEEKVEEITKNFIKVFDLAKPPLMRAELIEIGKEKHVLLLDVHHIIIDGTSFSIMVKEILALYEEERLEPLKIQYKDFAYWQNKLLESEKMKQQEQYWTEKFKGEIPVLNFPADYSRPPMQRFNGSKKYFALEEDIVKKLIKVCDKTETTLFMVLFAAYNVLLSRYSGQEDIVIGTPVSGRTHDDTQYIVGMFVNTLPIRTYPSGENKFTDYLSKVKDTILMGLENQDFQYEHLIEKLNIPRDMSRNPLFDTMFALRNIDIPEMKTKDLKFSQCKIDNNKSIFDITLSATEKYERIEFEIEYSTDLFKEDTINRLSEHFLNILKDISNNPEKVISDIEILGEEEKENILCHFNDTSVDYPKNKAIHQLFEEQVERTPNNIAVVSEHDCATYMEISEKSNQLAIILRKSGVKRDTIVGLMVERSIDMIVGIMGILKAGGAYMPIDPEYPKDRIAYMLENSGTKVLLTQENLKDIVEFQGEVINIKEIKVDYGQHSKIKNINKPSDLAYVIYTSGSTGKPKGVMIEHKNVINYVTAFQNEFYLSSQDVVLQQASFSFDAFVEEVYPILLSGGKLVLANKHKIMDVKGLRQIISNNKVTVISCSPALVNILNQYKIFEELRILISGGDVLKKEYISNLPSTICVYNTYGPTEATVCATYYKYKENEAQNNIPIGKPISNYKVYILDKNLNLLPIGIAGELCISGEGIGKGYLNAPNITEQKFISNPFNSQGKLYRTGDLAKWDSEGNIEYMGRIDNQVKIKGFRIELGEIENQLLTHGNIKDATVIDRKDQNGNKYLCAYIVCSDEMKISDLKTYLSKKLPNYMVPAYFITLNEIPLTPNGKTDIRALPEPKENLNIESKYAPPRDELEEKLCKIWSDILGIDQVGIDDDFFELGGDSLSLINVIASIEQATNKQIQISSIYTNRTINKIAMTIRKEEKNKQPEGIRLLRKGTSNKNIFFVHGGSGSIGGYVNIFKDGNMPLNEEFNCYAIEFDKSNGYGPMKISIEELAQEYIEKVLLVQPDGEFYFAAWCIGGQVIHEMATIIENKLNKKVNSVIIFNSVAPKNWDIRCCFELNNEIEFVSGLLGENISLGDISKIKDVRELWQHVAEIIKDRGDEVRTLIPEDVLHSVPNYKRLGILEIIYYINAMRTLHNARVEYYPNNRLQGQLYYFHPLRDHTIDNHNENIKLWQKYCSQKICRVEVEADEYSIFDDEINNTIIKLNNILK